MIYKVKLFSGVCLNIFSSFLLIIIVTHLAGRECAINDADNGEGPEDVQHLEGAEESVVDVKRRKALVAKRAGKRIAQNSEMHKNWHVK